MNITQLKSGNYRIRQTYKGKNYSITINHKPTKKEAMQLISDMLENDSDNLDYNNLTFKQGLEEYVRIKSNVLSPSTLTGYQSYFNSYSTKFLKMKINNITQLDVQMEINNFALDHSPKTVSNIHGLISAVMKEFRPRFVLTTRLPQKEIKDDYIPTRSNIEKILEEVSGTPYELALKLAICGLRRSEICALTSYDLDRKNILHINKAYIKSPDKKWVVRKMNKTDAGTRVVLLPNDFAQLYRSTKPAKGKEGRLFPYTPNSIYKVLCRVENNLMIPHFSLHKCRHYYCSLLHAEGIPDSMIMEMGGWKSDYTMKKVYRHAMTDDKLDALRKASDAISQIKNA